MNELDIHDQPRLGAVRTFGLTVTGVRYRLFRSFVSVSVIGVAVAFFMNLLGASLMKRSIGRAASRRLDELHQAASWTARLSHAGTLASLLDELAAAPADEIGRAHV